MATIKGTKKRDILNGFSGNDYLYGYAGNDDLKGQSGNDRLYGGDGSDKLYGGNGNDRLYGQKGSDKLNGDKGNDTLDGGSGSDTLNGGAGNDVLLAGTGADVFIGSSGIDTLSYAAAPVAGINSFVIDLSTGLGAEGSLGDKYSGIENVVGSATTNHLVGDDADNMLIGGGANDYLIGGGGNDTLIGGADSDYFEGGAGADSIDGGGGDRDTVSYANSLFGVSIDLSAGTGANGDAQGDTIANVEIVYGSDSGSDMILGDAADNYFKASGGSDELAGNGGNDILSGGSGADSLNGGTGNDILMPGDDDDADTLVGGAGDDTVSYADVTSSGVTVYLTNGTAGGKATGDTYAGIENVIGSQKNDSLRPAVNGIAEGSGGDDNIFDASGTEVLHGGLGDDHLYDNFFGTEDGLRDIFWLDLTLPGVDYVNGFDAGEDLFWIKLSDFDFNAYLSVSFDNPAPALLSQDQIINSTTPAATLAGPQLVYETDTSKLWFDPDGTGVQAIREIANIVGFAGSLDRMDFFLI